MNNSSLGACFTRSFWLEIHGSPSKKPTEQTKRKPSQKPTHTPLTHDYQTVLQRKGKLCIAIYSWKGHRQPHSWGLQPQPSAYSRRASAYRPLGTADGADISLLHIFSKFLHHSSAVQFIMHKLSFLSQLLFYIYSFNDRNLNERPSHVQPSHWNNLHVLDYSSQVSPLSSAHSSAVQCQRDQGWGAALQACCCSPLPLLRY